MSAYELAQLNIAQMRAPLDAPDSRWHHRQWQQCTTSGAVSIR